MWDVDAHGSCMKAPVPKSLSSRVKLGPIAASTLAGFLGAAVCDVVATLVRATDALAQVTRETLAREAGALARLERTARYGVPEGDEAVAKTDTEILAAPE